MGSDKKKKSRLSVLSENWSSFKKFLYDREEGRVLGRDGNSWSKILVFYLFYYGFLACLFAAAISIVLNTLDEYTPRYQTRLQTPGVAIQPKLPSNVSKTSNIFFSLKEGDSQRTKFVEHLDAFLGAYNDTNQLDPDLFKNCTTQPPDRFQEYKGDELAKACSFFRSRLGACVTRPYGYDEGKPCIYVKLNRIINWFPVGYTDLSRAVETGSGAPELKDLLQTYGNSYKPYLMYTYCYGVKYDDKKNLNGGTAKEDRLNTKYYPTENGFPFAFYPYYGIKRQPQYRSPLVAVQFTNVTRGVEINVNCKVYALNIRDNKDMGEGFFNFKLKIDE